ncbi:MAG: ABC transporter ATP-binding protein [Deltaproteobacteria bacterium]|nr:ABC transporter ATP-binding protein [Deltaproteobacteria bacterium]
MTTILETRGLTKTYGQGRQAVEVLRGVDVSVEQGEFVAVMGPSGSGKTTFMQLVGGLDRPTGGSVRLGGEPIETFSDARLSAFRRRKLGFVFQFFHLLPTLSAEENVCLPLLLDGASFASVAPQAQKLLERVGLGERRHHRPDQLSGGETQRVAIARALIADPVLILADEPTGNLDSKAGTLILELFRATVKERGQTVVMVTHDPRAAALADRVIRLRDGVVERDEPAA